MTVCYCPTSLQHRFHFRIHNFQWETHPLRTGYFFKGTTCNRAACDLAKQRILIRRR